MGIRGQKPKPHGLKVLEGGAKASDGPRYCGSPTNSGVQCRLTAGWGTASNSGPCIHHRDPGVLSDDGLPEPPAYLPEKAKELWRKIAPRLMKTGRLELEDLPSFEMMCVAYYFSLYAGAILIKEGLMQKDEAHKGQMRKHPMCQVWRNCVDILRLNACEFGMTPSSRARFEIPEARELTAMERLLQGDE